MPECFLNFVWYEPVKAFIFWGRFVLTWQMCPRNQNYILGPDMIWDLKTVLRILRCLHCVKGVCFLGEEGKAEPLLYYLYIFNHNGYKVEADSLFLGMYPSLLLLSQKQSWWWALCQLLVASLKLAQPSVDLLANKMSQESGRDL